MVKKFILLFITLFSLTLNCSEESDKNISVSITFEELVSNVRIKEFTGHDDKITCIAFSPNGQFIAAGSKDSNIIIWDITSGNKVKELIGHINSVISIAWSPDGNQIASSSDDFTIRKWDINSGKSSIRHNQKEKPVYITWDEKYGVFPCNESVMPHKFSLNSVDFMKTYLSNNHDY